MPTKKLNSNLSPSTDTLLEFPCEYPVKVMGVNHDSFTQLMCELIQTFVEHPIDTNGVSSRPSKSGKYSAVTITIQAKSKAQLDSIYLALYDHDDVHMTL